MACRMRSYPVEVEIAGPAAVWVRPDSGSSFVTYPAPTFSAVQGILDCVARWKNAYLEPERVEICAPIQTARYVTNYGGPLRNPSKGQNSYQLYSTILIDVCYKIHAFARERAASPDGTNQLHALQERFNRRIRQGKLYRTPCLGWSEMTPSYFGPLRGTTQACTDVTLELPSMLHKVFSHPQGGKYEPTYRQRVLIEKGVLCFAQ